MAIDNELKCCPGLRKMHLETAQVGARWTSSTVYYFQTPLQPAAVWR